MSQPANQPATKRPLTTADMSPPDAVPEGVEARSGGFRLPTERLRAYTMIIALVAIWLFFQWKTIGVNPRDYPYGIFLDEPTRGIDVGAKQEIYGHINRLAKEGLAIVLVSSELPEVLGLSDRVLVLHEGRVTGEFKRTEATPEAVMAAATGHTQRAA